MLALLHKKSPKIKTTISSISGYSLGIIYDVIYSNSADPMIFWREPNGQIVLSINSQLEFTRILDATKKHLISGGIFAINIEDREKWFPEKYSTNVFIFRDTVTEKTKKIYRIMNKYSHQVYILALQKEEDLSTEKVFEIFYTHGFSPPTIDPTWNFMFAYKL